jgi:hypothetical protein
MEYSTERKHEQSTSNNPVQDVDYLNQFKRKMLNISVFQLALTIMLITTSEDRIYWFCFTQLFLHKTYFKL